MSTENSQSDSAGMQTAKPAFSVEVERMPPPKEDAGATAPYSSPPQLGSELPAIPGYELQEELGRGAMGIVVKALHVELNRVVALKMILSGNQAGPAEKQRFFTEAQAAARLDHRAIVPIYGVGEHQGHHFFSMKLIEGGTLASRMAEFSAQQTVQNSAGPGDRQVKIAELLAKVAEAIQCAHEHGILHRDLKPGNILLDAGSEPHVADFGLAKRVEGESILTQPGVIVGTPSYMAPEQAVGQKKLTPAADVYSLGAILYELLTGRPPFRAETVIQTLVQVVEADPASPRSLNRAVARDLETICLKALAKNPEHRYQSAQEMADELRLFACGQPIKTRPAGLIERCWRRCQRNPAVAGLSAMLIIFLFVVLDLVASRFQPDPVPGSDGSLDRVKAAGKIVIAITDDHYPPMTFFEGGKLTGFDLDLAGAVAEQLGVAAEFKTIHWYWHEVPLGLNKGECDMVISSWNITPQRSQEVGFVEYLRTGQVFVCRRGDSIKNEQDLGGKVVVVVSGTIQHDYLLGLQEKGIAIKRIILAKASEVTFPYLKTNEADVTIVDEPVGRYWAKVDPDLTVSGLVGHAMKPNPMGMAFRQKDVQLREAVAKAVAAMQEDGRFAQILEKWFGK
jgi:eukaryotic-like serine/threonine-protein kinase